MINKSFVFAVILSLIGVLVQSLFGFSNALNQFSFVVLSLLACLIVTRFEPHFLLKTSHLVSLLGVIMLALLFILVDPIRGAQRWFLFFGFNLQPSVVFMPFFLLSLAIILDNLPQYHFKDFVKVLLLISVPLLLIFKQPDLGTALVNGFALFSMTYLANFPLKYFAWIALSSVPAVLVATRFLKPYQVSRLISFVNPNFDPSGINYNSLQSVIAIGSGFIFGKGLNASSQSRLYFLPESHTDFVFAALSEAFGFLGAFIVLGLVFYFFFSLLSEIRSSTNNVHRFYTFGVLSFFFIQTAFNIGMNLRLLPVVGVPLPFISYGGSSLLSSFLMVIIAVKLKKLN